ncbi:MAG TPA: type II toxin-antitoxin system RelE/ParE family toxin [Candidatus Yonathbacteria bacterium]|nr:type II toxin-antitoxin system RelE/ParE family toxin [Candidatus Yonathbacteria bacterium]
MSEYKIKFYKDSRDGKEPVLEYIEKLDKKNKTKVLKYVDFLRENKGYLDEPYSKHISGKTRELRVDFSRNRHRVFYFTFVNKTIILLYSFLKKTAKTPKSEIDRAKNNYKDAINNSQFYE